MNSTIKKTAWFLITTLFWLLIWQTVFQIVNNDLLVCSPISVFKRIIELSLTADFVKSVLYSIARIFLGLTLGIILGVLMAFVCNFEYAQKLFLPLRTMIKATPVASFIMLAWIWLKRDSIPVFISMLMVTPIIWGNVELGIKSVGKDIREFAKMYELPKKIILKNIYIPSILPHFTSALCTSAGLVWKAGIAAEVLCQPKNSIGIHLYGAKNVLDTLDVFAWTVVVIIISIILEKIIKFFMDKIHKKLDMVS